MAGLSTSYALMELEQIPSFVNGILDDENIGECSSHDDSGFDKNCTQLVTTGTHVLSDNETRNTSDEQKENKFMIGRGVQ
jgi:hypothetical protein